jgi:hypothetical protein
MSKRFENPLAVPPAVFDGLETVQETRELLIGSYITTAGFLETLEIDLDDAAADCQDLGR